MQTQVILTPLSVVPVALRTLPQEVYMRGRLSRPQDFPRVLSWHECVCKHCGKIGAGMHPVIVESFVLLRTRAGCPLGVNSAYRCPIHNANVGGEENSEHQVGEALDVRVPVGIGYKRFFELCKGLPDWVTCIIGYPDDGFVHMDCRPATVRLIMER